MDEPEPIGVEHRSRRTRGVGNGLAVKRTIVNLFAAEWRTEMAEVDADLVRSPGLEFAGHEGCLGECFLHLDVGRRALGAFGFRIADAPATVAPTVR